MCHAWRASVCAGRVSAECVLDGLVVPCGYISLRRCVGM
jgi:hypothetical protein